MSAPDLFADVFGSGRGPGPLHPDDVAVLARRALIFEALQKHVIYSTVDLELTTGLRYVALARSVHDDSLHIVGGGSARAHARAALVEAEDEDFVATRIVDLDALGGVDWCLLPPFTDAHIGTPYIGGLADLLPQVRASYPSLLG